jgi:6-phosphogluconolactonase
MSAEVVRTSNFVADAANVILEQARLALAERGEFRLALSGGNTPRPVYTKFGEMARHLPWEQMRFTFGDERCVPPNDSKSNFLMAQESLFTPFAVPEKSILRMRGEIDPALAAQEYEDALALLATQHGEPIYRHDLILLGMGEDGHTASLFPGTLALNEEVRRVVANYVPKLETWRLTMTYPLLNQARHVLFLVGKGKDEKLIENILAGDPQFPASRVRPPTGRLTWMIAA